MTEYSQSSNDDDSQNDNIIFSFSETVKTNNIKNTKDNLDDSKNNKEGVEMPPKIRVHALARQLGSSSKDIIKQLGKLGISGRSAQSTLQNEDAEKVRQAIVGQDEIKPVIEKDHDEYTSVFNEPKNMPRGESESYEPEKRKPNPNQRNRNRNRNRNEDKQNNPENKQNNREKQINNRIEKPQKSEQAEDFDINLVIDAALGQEEESSNNNSKRNRSRGRRGRGRGKQSEFQQNETEENTLATTDEEVEDDPADSQSKTRRRRRRRKAGDSNEQSNNETTTIDEDGSIVVVHERTQRRNNAREEVSSGSTRLNGKRLRYRERGNRRRPHILSEAEFLARRESVDRIMVVKEKQRENGESYTQVGVLEDGVLVEHFVTSSASTSQVGNIYLGEIQNVLPSMEAAFVDIGLPRNGVLYAGEVNWEAAGLDGGERKIEQALKPGDQVLVQVTKDPVGQKGARLTTQISFAGRYLVLVPGAESAGISRRLPEGERNRLKDIISKIISDDAGIIVRTAAEGISEEDLKADLERLSKTRKLIDEEVVNAKSSGKTIVKSLYKEPDFLVKVIRDLFSEDFSKLIVQGEGASSTVEDYISMVAPDLMNKVEKYSVEKESVFDVYRIEEHLAKALDRKVWLPSGGTLIIERTEAMTVIDVNTGKFTGVGGNLEETVTKNNLEAAEEIVRQLRLRDIGGMIVVDFIDMVLESNQEQVLRRLHEALSRDRTRHQVSEVTSLGLVQITRKRIGTGLLEAFAVPCDHCNGSGHNINEFPREQSFDNADEEKSYGYNAAGSSGTKVSRRKAKPETTPSLAQVSGKEHPMFKAKRSNSDDDLDEDNYEELGFMEEISDSDSNTDVASAALAAIESATKPNPRTSGVKSKNQKRKKATRKTGEGNSTVGVTLSIDPSEVSNSIEIPENSVQSSSRTRRRVSKN